METEYHDNQIIGIRDPVISKTGAGAAWGVGNEVVAFPTSFPSIDKTEQCSQFSEVNCHQIKWETTLFHSQVRKLLNESCGTFVALQKLENKQNLQELLKISKQYRSVIKACIEDLNNFADTSTSPDVKADSENLSEIFYKIELVWNLCEIMFLNKGSSGLVLHQLVEWIHLHFPAAQETAAQVLSSPHPVQEENYWEAIYGLVLQLKVEQARKILRLHPDFDSESFQSADELLQKMPLLGSGAVTAVPEFTFRWTHWQTECESRFNAGDFADCPELEKLVQILCGNDIEGFDVLFETWYQRLVSHLIFTQPTITVGTVAEEAERFTPASATQLDSILLSIFRKDTQQIISEVQSVLDNVWFTAHLADLLYHAGSLSSFDEKNSANLRESLIRDYAVCLFSHESLWSVGMLYLDHCPSYGVHFQEALLSRVNLSDEKKAAKVLAMAKQRHLTTVAATVCRVMGLRALRSGRLGVALAWSVRSQDGVLASHAAEALLQRYLADSSFSSTDLLDTLGAGMLASEKLAFLGKYREFHRLYAKRDRQAAAQLLVSLISSRIAPKYFWSVLLMDALPLLETDPLVFSEDQTYELMQCLQEMVSIPAEENGEPNKPDLALDSDKSALISLALARNLARCFVQENSLPEQP